jgi:hypothetical protein
LRLGMGGLMVLKLAARTICEKSHSHLTDEHGQRIL